MIQDWHRMAELFDEKKSFVLATICETHGSTYKKAGAMMLFAEESFVGLISGGCLEGDLQFHAKACLQENQQTIVTYDLRGEQNDWLGLGLGCEGVIEVLLQPLTPSNEHLGFGTFLNHIQSNIISIKDTYARKNKKHFCFQALDSKPCFNFYTEEDLAKSSNLSAVIEQAFNGGDRHIARKVEFDGKRFLCSVQQPQLKVLICGAGPEVEPFIQMCKPLGWHVSVIDHRQALLDSLSKLGVLCKKVSLSELASEEFELDSQYNADVIVIMSHHLAADTAYLIQALNIDVNFVGLLGPAQRREKILESINVQFHHVSDRLYSPVGLSIKTYSPATIALSIIAQIQEVSYERI